MPTRATPRHKTKEITLVMLAAILLSSLLILLFPASLAIGRVGQSLIYQHSQ
jgi:hypothetical protein